MPVYTIEIQGLEKIKNAFKRSPKKIVLELGRAIKNSVNIIRPLMRKETPRASGLLSRSIYARVSGLEGAVGPNLDVTPYAIYVHEGTRPHEIRPVTKKALYWKGALHPVKRVLHPGTKPNPFVERTAENSREIVNMIFARALENINIDLAK
jgi:HK97 gp10 family phage protein